MTVNDYENVSNSCTICIVLLVIFLIICIRISAFAYFHWYLKKGNIECNSIKTIIY